MSFADGRAVLSEQIAQKIIDEIKAGGLSPGDKLPSEKQLIEKYQVSRITVREALRTLKVMNIINIKQGKGAFVSSVDISLLIDHMDFVSLLEKTTVLNLFEARRILEPEIAALAAQRITEQEIEDLRALLTQDNFDVILHQKIAECTKNPVLIRFVASIWTLSDMSRRRTSKIPGVKQKTYKMHEQLIEALASHDAALAKKLMCEHLEYIEGCYQTLVDTTDS